MVSKWIRICFFQDLTCCNSPVTRWRRRSCPLLLPLLFFGHTGKHWTRTRYYYFTLQLPQCDIIASYWSLTVHTRRCINIRTRFSFVTLVYVMSLNESWMLVWRDYLVMTRLIWFTRNCESLECMGLINILISVMSLIMLLQNCCNKQTWSIVT